MLLHKLLIFSSSPLAQNKSQVQSSLTCRWLMEAWTTYLRRPQQELSQSLAQYTTMNYWWDITTIHMMPLLVWLGLRTFALNGCLLIYIYIEFYALLSSYINLCCVDSCQTECNLLFSTEREEPCDPHSIYCCGIEGICGHIWRGISCTKCCKSYQFIDGLRWKISRILSHVIMSLLSYM